MIHVGARLAAVLALLVLVAGLAGPPATVAGSTAQPATSTAAAAAAGPDLGFSSVAAVAPAKAGGWWVLERSLQSQGGAVYRYTDAWVPTGEVHPLRIRPRADGTRSFSPTDLVTADGGGWWVLGEDGRVHRFASDFTDTGESHPLPRPNSPYNASEAFGIQRSGDGGWWVAANRDFWRTDEAWAPVDGTPVDVQSRSGGYAVAAGYGQPSGLWVLEGYLGTGVSLYPLADDGARIDPDAIETYRADGGGSSRQATPLVGYELQVADVPVDVARSGGGWWVVDADGQVHRFDRYWRYTGVTHAVGSGEAVGSYPSDVVSVGGAVVPVVVGASWLGPVLVVFVGLWWRREPRAWREDALAGAGALAFVYGVVMDPHLARPVVFSHALLPLVVTLLSFGLPAVHVYHHATAGRRARVKPLVLAYAPVIVGVLAMVRPAVRPLLPPFG